MGHRGLEQVTTEERKLATILFADIVGSTAPVASEDPEIVRRTLSRAFAEMRQVLTEHGGTVEKFIGDAVMAVFGVPQAHDDDADRAVRAAIVLRARLAELSKTLPYELRLRIGVNTGQVVAGTQGAETLVTGEPVTAAARLQQGAAPNEILVGTATRRLTQAEIRYGPARSVQAKGLGEIEGHPAEAAVSAVPGRTRGLGELRAPLIGRDAELRLLRESFAGSGAGRAARLVTVYGEPGVGKSRLAAEFVDIVGPDRVLRGRCLPYGSGVTYWPLLEMIRASAGILATDVREVAREKLRSSVPAAPGAPPEDAEAIERRLSVVAALTSAEESLPQLAGPDLGRELRWGVRRYFEQRATSGPLALVFDDIQWAEEPMLAAIEHLVERSRAPLFIVCLTRPELRDRRWAGGLTNAVAVTLEPLDRDATDRLIRALLDVDELPDRLRNEVAARAQGNPLYVEEFLRMLLDTGHVIRRDGRSIATGDLSSLPVPATLQGLLAARLDQLPPSVKRTVQIASVMGEVFYPEALPALAPSDMGTDDALLAAMRHDLVLESDERSVRGERAYAFKHILVRDAAYGSLPKEERSRLHDRFARWLAEVAADRREDLGPIMAHHAYEAYRLAREIREPQAAELGRRALDLLLDAMRRSRVGGDLRLQHQLHQRASQVAEAVGADVRVRAEASGFAAKYVYEMEGSSRIPDLDAAQQLAGGAGPSEILVELLLLKAKRSLVADLDAARAAFEEAVGVAEAHGDPQVIAKARVDRRWPAHVIGDLDAENEILLDAYRYIAAKGVAHGFDFFRGGDAHLFALHWNAIQRGDHDLRVRWEREIIEASSHHTSKFFRTGTHVWLEGWRRGFAGDHDGAADAGARLCDLDLEFGSPPILRAWHETARGRSLYAARRYGEALDAIGASVEIIEPLKLPYAVGDLRQFLARVLLKLGRLEEARAAAETADREIEPWDAISRCNVETSLAMVRAAEGRPVEAERLFRQALAVARGYRWTAMEAQDEFIRFFLAEGRGADARPLAQEMVAFFDHPAAAGRKREAEELLRRCEDMAAIR